MMVIRRLMVANRTRDEFGVRGADGIVLFLFEQYGREIGCCWLLIILVGPMAFTTLNIV